MFRFSCKILVSNITTIINNNILNFLLGHYFTARDTGNYNQAYQWDFKCFSLIQGMINQVAQPVLVDLRSESERQLNALRKMMRFTSFLSFPLLFGFGLVAHEFIVIAIGTKWLTSAGYLQTLCLAGATMPLFTLLSNMVVSKGAFRHVSDCHGMPGPHRDCHHARHLVKRHTHYGVGIYHYKYNMALRVARHGVASHRLSHRPLLC